MASTSMSPRPLSAASVNQTLLASSISGSGGAGFLGLSNMHMAFLVTGVIGGVAAMLGVVYMVLYHTRMSNSSQRKMAHQNNSQDTGMRMSLCEESKRRDSRRESSSRRNTTQTHFRLFKVKRYHRGRAESSVVPAPATGCSWGGATVAGWNQRKSPPE